MTQGMACDPLWNIGCQRGLRYAPANGGGMNMPAVPHAGITWFFRPGRRREQILPEETTAGFPELELKCLEFPRSRSALDNLNVSWV